MMISAKVKTKRVMSSEDCDIDKLNLIVNDNLGFIILAFSKLMQ